ncbi:MAG TPA: alpha/beta fold hydrolase [Polyangiaceae bacterium]|nr:alpha/beta fold hydrolase [Polyangiaceae bacterium]
MSRLRWLAWGSIAIAAVTAGLVALRSARLALSVVHPARSPVPPDARAQALAEVPTLEDATLHTADGLSLRAWFSPGSRGAVVIFVHGLWGNRESLFPEARLLAQHGYGILVYDSRASGESDGDLATWGDREQLDVRAAVDYALSRPEIQPARVALLGFSVGASTAAMAMASDPRLRALVLCATWSSFEDEWRAKFSAWGPITRVPAMLAARWSGVNPDRIRPIDVLGTVGPRPILMIAGTLDDDTPLDVERRVFAAASEPKELWVVAGAHHGDYLAVAAPEFESRVVAFLDHALFGQPATTGSDAR